MKLTLKFPILFFLNLVLIFPSCSITHEEQPVVVIRDLSYGSDSLQKLDVFLPPHPTGNTKTVVVIHGGGWSQGDKSGTGYFSAILANHGFAAVQINYRLAGRTARLPEMMDDIASAIRFIEGKSVEWGVDTHNIALFGHSAGAHLALVYAYRNDSLKRIRAVVSLAGPTDLLDTNVLNKKVNQEMFRTVIGDTIKKHWKDAGPINIATSKSPPTILLHGKMDPYFPFNQSVVLNEKLISLGVVSKLILFEKEGHELYPPIISQDNNSILWDNVIRFLKENTDSR